MCSIAVKRDRVADPETVVNRVRRAGHGAKVGPVGAHPQGLQEGALLERRLAQFWMTGSTIHDRPRRTAIVLEVDVGQRVIRAKVNEVDELNVNWRH